MFLIKTIIFQFIIGLFKMQQKTGGKPLENADNSYNFNMENKGKRSVFLKKNDVNHIIMIHIIIIVTYLLRRKIKFYMIFFF